ncbi:hypothetical protein ACWGBH_34340 [Streptomyces massasporeus]
MIHWSKPAPLREHLDAIAENTRRPRGLAEHRAGPVRRLRNLGGPPRMPG